MFALLLAAGTGPVTGAAPAVEVYDQDALTDLLLRHQLGVRRGAVRPVAHHMPGARGARPGDDEAWWTTIDGSPQPMKRGQTG